MIPPPRFTTVVLTLLLIATGGSLFAEPPSGDWRDRLERDLPLLGHRNWIVIADAAYPAQSRPGIETVYIGGDQIDAVEHLLDEVKRAKHVRGLVYVDDELASVAERDAPGVTDFRRDLDKALKGQAVSRLPHEKIISRLDESARVFRVVIYKTDMTIPYTSVFVQLDCGYWNAEAEDRLRRAIRQRKE